jgi:hypothetical protein
LVLFNVLVEIMKSVERHELFKSTLTELRVASAKVGVPVAERRFLEAVRKRVTEQEWNLMEAKVDRVASGVPHHLEVSYKPRRDKPRLRAWLKARYLFMFGVRVCEHCGSRTGKLFRPLENVGTGFKGLWHRFCSDSCSKSSEGATEKRKNTCLKIYKADNVSRSAHFRKKMVVYWKQFDSGQLDDRNEKTRNTKIRKHGSVEAAEAARAIKMVKTNMERYGGPAATCSPEVRRKVEQTNLRRRGVTNPSKDPEVMRKIQESWKSRKEITVGKKIFTGLQGYEPQAVLWLTKNGVKPREIERPRSGIPYRIEGVDRIYHPDLLVTRGDRRIMVEVKSVYTASIFLDTPESHNYGTYNAVRLKLNACTKLGYEVRLLIPHNGGCFVWDGKLPTNRDSVARAFNKWVRRSS